MQKVEDDSDTRSRRGLPFRHAGLHQAGAGIEARESVARTRNQAEELRRGVDEVEDLGDEQQEQGFAEVSEDANDGKYHAREIAVGVAHEDAGGIPVVAPQRQTDADEGEQHVQREEMGVRRRMRERAEQVEGVVEHEQEGDDEGLGDFDAVYAREDVDAVRAEDGDCGHVDVVEGPEVEQPA